MAAGQIYSVSTNETLIARTPDGKKVYLVEATVGNVYGAEAVAFLTSGVGTIALNSLNAVSQVVGLPMSKLNGVVTGAAGAADVTLNAEFSTNEASGKLNNTVKVTVNKATGEADLSTADAVDADLVQNRAEGEAAVTGVAFNFIAYGI